VATQLLKTVKLQGGDYTSLAACISDNEQDLVTADQWLDVEIDGQWNRWLMDFEDGIDPGDVEEGGAGTVTLETSNPLNGSQSGLFTIDTGVSDYAILFSGLISDEVVIKFKLELNSGFVVDNSESHMNLAVLFDNNDDFYCVMYINSDLKLGIYHTTYGFIGESSTALTTGVTYEIEIRAKINDTTGYITLLRDSVEQFSQTGIDTLLTGDEFVYYFVGTGIPNGASSGNTSATSLIIDDMDATFAYAIPDTTELNINSNYTTDATRYINIFTSGTARHDGVFSTSYYYIQTVGQNSISGGYVTLTGIQIEHKNGYDYNENASAIVIGQLVTLDKNIIVSNPTNTNTSVIGIRRSNDSLNGYATVKNNIVYLALETNRGTGVHGYDHLYPPDCERDNQGELIEKALDILRPFLPEEYLYRAPGFQVTCKTEPILKSLGFSGIAHQGVVKYFGGGFVNTFDTHCCDKFLNPVTKICEEIVNDRARSISWPS